jgi:Uma2 family endonuclease
MKLPIVDAPLPLRFRPSTPMTEYEFLRFCSVNDVLWVEREVDGELSVKPIGGCRVSSVNLAVGTALRQWAEEDGRGETFANAGFTLPDGSMRGAHTAWMLNERWESLTKQWEAQKVHLTPSLYVPNSPRADGTSTAQRCGGPAYR